MPVSVSAAPLLHEPVYTQGVADVVLFLFVQKDEKWETELML
jgi:hypothetical protein